MWQVPTLSLDEALTLVPAWLPIEKLKLDAQVRACLPLSGPLRSHCVTSARGSGSATQDRSATWLTTANSHDAYMAICVWPVAISICSQSMCSRRGAALIVACACVCGYACARACEGARFEDSPIVGGARQWRLEPCACSGARGGEEGVHFAVRGPGDPRHCGGAATHRWLPPARLAVAWPSAMRGYRLLYASIGTCSRGRLQSGGHANAPAVQRVDAYTAYLPPARCIWTIVRAERGLRSTDCSSGSCIT